MATTVSFKQPCPSCEHPVPIRDPKLIGRKIDCPKCKYRFVVEEPAEAAGDDEGANGKGDTAVTTKKKGGDSAVTTKKAANGKAAPAKKPVRRRDEDDGDEIDDSAPKKKKGGMSPILILGVALGAIAVIGLGVTLVLILTGEEGSSKPPTSGAANQQKPPEDKKPEEPVAKGPAIADGGDLVALLNLVPNDTEVVRKADIDKLLASDLGDSAFKPFRAQTNSFSQEAFAAKWGFPLESIARHVQAQSVKQDWIFNVIRTKTPIDFEKLKVNLALKKGPKSPIGAQEYFTVTAELDAFSRFWFTDLYMFTDPTRNKPLGLYKSDDQTLILAELDPLEKFLQKRPEIIKPPETPPPAGGNPGQPGMPPGGMAGMAGMGGSMPPGGMAGMAGSTPPGGMAGMGGSMPKPPSGPPAGGPTGTGVGSGGPTSGPPAGGPTGTGVGSGGPTSGPPAGGPTGTGVGSGGPTGMGGSMPPGGMGGSMPPPGGMGGMMPGGMQGGGRPAGPSAGWLTLKPELKKMLDRLEDPKPAILSIAMLGDTFTTWLTKSPDNLGVDLSKVPDTAKQGTKAAGAAIYAAKLDRVTLSLGIDYAKDEDAKTVETKLNELLPLITLGVELQYGVKVTATSGQNGMFGGLLGGMGGMMPGGMGGMPPGGNGGMVPPGGNGGMVPPGGMGGMAPGGNGGMVPPGGNGGMKPPGGGNGGMVPPGGNGGMVPPGGMGGMMPGGMGGMMPGGNGNGQPQGPSSTIGITRQDALLVMALDVAWNDKLRDSIINDVREGLMMARATTEMSGTRPRVHQLAAALQMYKDKHAAFPRGAYDRISNAERFNRPWAPDQRISWMAEVLRYLPQYQDEFANNPGAYPLGIQPNQGWNENANLMASRMLVPQFLAQNSPEDQWRVHYPKVLVPVAATHFVGLAGIGLDAAEEGTPPNRRGVFSYDRPTQFAEITDGPQNTIAVLQGPPDFKTPWLAGGGSTVRGVQEKDSIRPFVCAEFQGKKGTYAIMANGDVRFIYEDVPDSLFQAMVTIAGNEPPIKKEEWEKYAPLIPAPEVVELKAGPLPPPGGEVKPPPPPAAGDAAERLKKMNDLKQIGLAYHNFFAATTKAPAKVEDLEPYYEKNPKITAALKDGTYVFFYNVKLTDMVNGSSNTILGYEKDAPTKGGAVLFGDGSVKPLTADEFAKAAKPPGH
jgi:Protein of unknown function (DUF1559)